MKSILFALLTLSISTFAFADGGLPTQPYIYVEGNAEIEKPADMVVLRFDLAAQNADQAKANQEVQSKASKIFGLFNERKIVRNDVVATDLRSEAEYENPEESARKRGKVIGYVVIRSFTVTVRDVPTFPKLVDELLAITGVGFSGIDGGLSKEKETQGQLWDKALADARIRAETTLKPAGMKIDSVFAISPVAYPEIESRIFASREGSTERIITTGASIPGEVEVIRSEYRVADVRLKQSIHVIYLISPAK